jgi:hypothetical protein
MLMKEMPDHIKLEIMTFFLEHSVPLILKENAEEKRIKNCEKGAS